MQQATQTWHLLQISGPLDEELASALSETVPVIGWKPERDLLSSLLRREGSGTVDVRSPSFHIRTFPIMPGYARQPISAIARVGSSLNRLLQGCTDSANDVLVCTTPYMAPVAERWPGPVVYWLTDRIASYASAAGIDVVALDRRMCAAADLVCPNSERLRNYLLQKAGCDPRRLAVLPNATREQNLLPSPLLHPLRLPATLGHHSRPVAGVIGNMGGNIDWQMLQAVVRATPWLTWAFVGPVGDDILDEAQLAARQAVQNCRNACFVGRKPYGELVSYARSFDVAVLPYRLCEPTYSGSSTRFYEHLAACRPMLATHGFAELLKKEPLLKLVGDSQQMVNALTALRATGFSDGVEAERWMASQSNTWQTRAATMQQELAMRTGANAQEQYSEAFA